MSLPDGPEQQGMMCRAVNICRALAPEKEEISIVIQYSAQEI